MYDILALAFQTDSTRVSTFIVAHDGSNRPYPTIGIRDGHHDLSHLGDDDASAVDKLTRIDTWYAEQLASLIKLTERYCVIYQTLRNPPKLSVSHQVEH